MPRADDREAARRLAGVLDGTEPGDADLATVARVLRDAAAAARFDVLRRGGRAGPRARAGRRRRRLRAPRSRLRVAGVMLAVAAALAVAIVLALPFTSAPVTVDVQARALAALSHRGKVLSVAEVVRPGPGQSFPPSLRTGWIDIEGGRQRWTQSVGGTVVAETLVDHGRVTRYDPASGTAVVATSCAALASGCAEGVDPVAFYRRALVASGPLRSSARDVDGSRVFRVVLPVQTLADRVRIVQVATHRRCDVPAAPDRMAPGSGRRARADLRRDRRPRHRPRRREHRGPERPRPSAAPGDGDHPGRRPRRSRAPPRRTTADGCRGSDARPLAVVVRARLPRPPAERDRAGSLHGRNGGTDPLRVDDDLDVRPRDPAAAARRAGAPEDDPPRWIDRPVLRDPGRHPGRRAIDPVGNGRGGVTQERLGVYRPRQREARCTPPVAAR